MAPGVKSAINDCLTVAVAEHRSVAVSRILVVFGGTGVGQVPHQRVWIQRRH